MDFRFTSEEEAFRTEVHDFIEKDCPKELRGGDVSFFEQAGNLFAWRKKVAQKGWVAPAWPKEYGGAGMSIMEQFIYSMETARMRAPAPIFIGALAVAVIGPTIIIYGSEEQKKKHIPKILAGEEMWCQGFSEPGSGSDLASLRTRAERRGDTFVVNGQKVWTSHADIADWCFLLCRTEPDAAKHAGLSLLLVDMRSPGITVRPLRQMNGEAEFSEVFFDGVEVGEDRLVGAAGAGWQIAMGILAHERGPVWTFTFQRRIRRSLGELIRSARDRGALRDPVVRQRLAQAHIEVELLRLVGYRSLTRLLRTGRPGAESSIEKVLGSETDQRLQELAMDVSGAHGLLCGDFGQAWLYSRSETIMGGTSEIQRNVIATRILGLPR